MYHLLRKQVILFLLLTISYCNYLFAQGNDIHRIERDDVPYYFGLTLGYNTGFLAIQKNNKFLQDDSVLVAEPLSSRGISLGLHATAKLNDYFELKFNPQLILGGARSFSYKLKAGLDEEAINQTLPTTLLSFPLSFKFNSDRINNFRTYLLLGAKLDIDLSANSAERLKDNYIKLAKYDYGAEAGIGFNIFMRYFTLSPELKISYGFNNILDRDPANKYSAVFNSLQTRMIMFSLHFEQ